MSKPAIVATHSRTASEDTPKPPTSSNAANGTPVQAAKPAAVTPTVVRESTPAAAELLANARAVSEAPSAGGEDALEDEDDEEIIDMETFEQILELDEDDTHDFSSGMAWQYFSQAQVTFKEMDEALEKTDLTQLSHLGHFLKGSSAALGVNKVRTVCEKIQHYGLLWDDDTHKDLSRQEALDKITPLLPVGKKGYAEAETWLKSWFKVRGVNSPTEDDE